MSVKSPVTLEGSTELEFSIPKQNIIAQYQELGIDVSRFFLNISQVDVCRCLDTGYRFYYPFDIFGDGPFYADLDKLFSGYYMAGRWEHQKAIEIIQKNDTVLEVGCGSGYFLEQLQKKGVQSAGLELNATALKQVRAKGLVAHDALLDSYAPLHESKYDVVCSFQVLEHVFDVHHFILQSLQVLKPGGKLIIGVPNNNPFIFRHDKFHTLNLPPHHAGLWNREVFTNLPQHFELKPESIFIEPLREVGEWLHVQKQHAPNKSIYKILPRPVMKFLLRMMSNRIEGRNILAVFSKPK